MKASGVMTRDVKWVSSDTSLQEAYATMTALNIRHLPVVELGKLRGIVSDRDLLLRAQKTNDGDLVMAKLAVGEVMTLNPVTCRLDDSVATLARLMLEHGIDCIPVTSMGDELQGMVTSRDLVGLAGVLDTLPEA